eukprot:2304720-Pyramimonas_sp.AAC.1
MHLLVHLKCNSFENAADTVSSFPNTTRHSRSSAVHARRLTGARSAWRSCGGQSRTWWARPCRSSAAHVTVFVSFGDKQHTGKESITPRRECTVADTHTQTSIQRQRNSPGPTTN